MCAARLSIPKQTGNTTFSIGSDEASIKAWVEALPIADAEKTVVTLLPVLIEANRIEIDYQLRLKFMVLLVPVVDAALASIRQKYLSSPSPFSSEKNIKRIEVVKRIHQEMAFGFKFITIKIIGAHDEEANKRLSTVIFYAEHYLACLLIEHYLLYEPVVENVWGELNLLYRYAVKAGIHNKLLDTVDGDSSSVEQVYMQLILLAVINPYRLMRGEAEKIHKMMAGWSHISSLDTPADDWTPGGEVVIDLASDRPPIHSKLNGKFEDLTTVRILNVDRVKKLISDQLAEKRRNVNLTPIETLTLRLQRDMLQRLMGGWKSDVDRESERIDSQAVLELAFGMKECSLIFGEGKTLVEKRENVLDSYGLIPEDEHWGAAPKPKPGASVFRIDDPTRDIWEGKHSRVTYVEPEEEEGPKATLFSVKQVDVSAGGFGLEFDHSQNIHAKVGDLICLRLSSSDVAPWRLGDVRWQQVRDGGKVGIMGVRLLAENVAVLSVKAIAGPGKDSSEADGLLINGLDFDDPGVELIIPPTIYDVDTILRVHSESEVVKVKLTEKVESTSAFARFKFELQLL